MRLSSGLSPQALGLELGEQVGAPPLVGLRVSRTTVQTLVACAIVPMVAVTVALALTSEHLQRPVAAALYWSYLITASMAIGLYWWVRRPASRFGALLIAFGILVWVMSWQGSDVPLVFDLGVLVEAPGWLLTIYLFLAFPMGRVEPRAARWLMAALAFGVMAFFLPWFAFSPVVAGGGPLTRCAPNCPENVLQLGSSPNVAEVAGKAETYVALTLTAAVFVVYLARLLSASRPQRRALMAVAVTSLLFLPAFFVFNFAAWILVVDDVKTLDVLAWGIVGTRILLPLGFLIALLQAEHFAVRALRVLLERLAARPTPEQWRDTIAGALDDRSLRLGFHDPSTGSFREPSGAQLTPPAPEADRAWVPVDRDDHPVAAMVIDETLTEDPELVGAAASATLLAVENGALEGELQASRARILEAGHAERRRIERDLHDSAQQRLVALRIQLALASEQLDRAQERAMLERLGSEVEQAIDELRDLARGVYPQLLGELGIGRALEAVARHSAMPVTITDDGLARHSQALETTVYFCCLECLQNAAKHAGTGASVAITLGEHDGQVSFSVADDGVGFDPVSVEHGLGLTHLRDRVAAVGGSLRIDSRPGHGTHITGELPTYGT
jgi:signal transduction histidine kinase